MNQCKTEISESKAINIGNWPSVTFQMQMYLSII